jgi:HTH-type transcriptional regulator/antitoxin HigA
MATKLSNYDSLLLEFKPRPILNKRDHARALRQIDTIMRRGPKLPRAESELVEVLAALIENCELFTHPGPQASPADRLAHLIDARGITNAELAAATGISRSTITNVIANRRKFSTANVARLANYFEVPAGDFIESPA